MGMRTSPVKVSKCIRNSTSPVSSRHGTLQRKMPYHLNATSALPTQRQFSLQLSNCFSRLKCLELSMESPWRAATNSMASRSARIHHLVSEPPIRRHQQSWSSSNPPLEPPIYHQIRSELELEEEEEMLDVLEGELGALKAQISVLPELVEQIKKLSAQISALQAGATTASAPSPPNPLPTDVNQREVRRSFGSSMAASADSVYEGTSSCLRTEFSVDSGLRFTGSEMTKWPRSNHVAQSTNLSSGDKFRRIIRSEISESFGVESMSKAKSMTISNTSIGNGSRFQISAQDEAGLDSAHEMTDPIRSILMVVIATAVKEGSAARRIWILLQNVVSSAKYMPFVICLTAEKFKVEVFGQYLAHDVHFLRAFTGEEVDSTPRPPPEPPPKSPWPTTEWSTCF